MQLGQLRGLAASHFDVELLKKPAVEAKNLSAGVFIA